MAASVTTTSPDRRPSATRPVATRGPDSAASAPQLHMPIWMWVVPILWGGAFLTGASALKRLSPDTVTFLRFAITVAGASIVLHAPILAFLRARPTSRQWLAITLLALFGGVAYHVAFYAGLKETQPPVASVVIATNPILTTLGAAIFLRDRRPTPSIFVGLALAFAGVFLLAMDKPLPDADSLGFFNRLARGWGRGETLCLVASCCWAVFAVLMQHFRGSVLKSLPGPGVTVAVYAVTTLLMLPIVVATGGIRAIPSMRASDWGCMLYLGLVATVIAYTLYNAAIDRVGSARVSQVTYAVPALTTLLTLAFDSAFQPSWVTWIGLAVVTAGLVVSDGRLVGAIRERFGD